MPAIIDFVQGLIDKGAAYVSGGDVYFDIAAYPHYCTLSRHKLEDLRAGARVEPNEKKKDPLDFALWKSEPEGQFWQAPWGWGRPGWHIECSALAAKYLGLQIDIHGGGQDLIFPHHENELAQSQALHDLPLARYWMHNAFVRVNQEKMSKSLNNFFTLQDIFMQYDPMIVRFYFLNHQYRAPLDFVLDELEAVQKSYQRLCRIFAMVPTTDTLTHAEISGSKTVQEMVAFLCDDLNTPGMLGVLFENLSALQSDINELRAVKLFLMNVLGLSLLPLPEKQVIMTPEIEKLVLEREHARAAKDWARADALRNQLRELGFEVQDKKN
jgi:cysteinyl-tRNA synthetase